MFTKLHPLGIVSSRTQNDMFIDLNHLKIFYEFNMTSYYLNWHKQSIVIIVM
jgi:hypothetical protein